MRLLIEAAAFLVLMSVFVLVIKKIKGEKTKKQNGK